MKKFITFTLAAVLLVAALCAAHKPFRTYPHTALVTALDEKTDNRDRHRLFGPHMAVHGL